MDGTTKNTGREDLRETTFEWNHKDFSVGTDGLCELTTDKPTWCRAIPSKRKLAASAWRLAIEKVVIVPHVAGMATLFG